jgi:hypothetical protein
MRRTIVVALCYILASALIPNPPNFHWWHAIERSLALTIMFAAGMIFEEIE